MPEGYTHFRIAAKAAASVRYKVKDPAAFAAGANGPDIFFCYEAWRKAAKRHYDLPALGRRMHEENTGAFLQNLVRNVRTAPQVEYALGFLSHYAADTVLHPYVAALCQPGMPYAEPGGHGYFEIALDSTLHAQDTNVPLVPAQDACPCPTGEALAEIVDLLHRSLLQTYGLDVPAEYIADSFYESNKLRGMFTSRLGVRKAAYWLIEPLFGGRGAITGHVSPRKLKPGLPASWQDPATGAPREGDVYALMEVAQERSAQYMAAAILIWNGRQTYAFLADLLGSVSYSTGTPTERSDPNYVPPEPPAAPEPAEPGSPGPAPQAEQAATPAEGEAGPAPAQGPPPVAPDAGQEAQPPKAPAEQAGGPEGPAAPEDTPTAQEDIPTAPEDTPAAPEDTPTAQEDTPAAPEDTPAAQEDTPAAQAAADPAAPARPDGPAPQPPEADPADTQQGGNV